MENHKIDILIVEDNTITALDLKMSLEMKKYKITSVEKTLRGVKKSIKVKLPKLAIVDINLGGGENGIKIGEYLTNQNIPIIYSTSYSDNKTINKALETDPICYLIKPINLQELICNITLTIYKTYTLHPPTVQLNSDYSFDNRSNKLFYHQTPIFLSKMELKLLRLLIASKGGVVLIENLEYHLWKSKSVKESTLRTIVYRLRKKLPKELIKTVSGLGFSLIE